MNKTNSTNEVSAGLDPLEAVRKELAKGNIEVHKNVRAWPQISIDVSTQEVYSTDDLIGDSTNIIARVAKEYERIVNFPSSTAYLHGLGAISCAMLRKFTWKTRLMSGTTGLMVVTSQPPSSGKSGLNNKYTGPYSTEIDRLNTESYKQRVKIKKKIKQAKDELDEASNDNQIDMLVDKITKLNEDLRNVVSYCKLITNPTAEGLERDAKEGGGFYNFISDEDGGLNTLLGLAYGGGNSHSNLDTVLQAWNGDYIGVARSGREGYRGTITGAISVIAQERAVRTMFEASTRGVGFTERFLMWCEKDRLGTREFEDIHIPWSKDVNLLIPALIHNIMKEKPTELKVSDEAQTYMVDIKNHYEKMCAPGKTCAVPVLRGFAMKVETHIYKIASVLHVCEQWLPTAYDAERGVINNLQPKGALTISKATVAEAAKIFGKIMRYYVIASDANLAGGRRSELEIVREKLKARAEKGQRRITKKVLLDDIKRISAFKNQPSLGKHLAEHVFPKLEAEGIMCVSNSEIYINPNFA